MDTRFRRFPVLLFIAVFWTELAFGVVRVAVGEESARLIHIESNRLAGRIGGLYQCVFDRTGLAFEFISMPIKRAVYQLQIHDIDVVIPMAQLAARDEYADFGGPLVYAEYVFVSLSEIPEIDATPDLRFVLLRGFAGNRFVYDRLPTMSAPPPLEVSSWQQVSGILGRGRADITVMPQQDVGAINADTVHTQPAGQIPASLYVSRVPVNRELLETLQLSVKACHNEYIDSLDNL